MSKLDRDNLGCRERQVLTALQGLGRASVEEVQARLADRPSYSAVRAALNALVAKEIVVAERQKRPHLYAPATPQRSALRSSWKRLVDTFYRGSAPKAAVSLVRDVRDRLSPEDIAELEEILDKAKRAGK